MSTNKKMQKFWALVADDKIVSIEESEILECANGKRPTFGDFPIVCDADFDLSEFSKIEVIEVSTINLKV